MPWPFAGIAVISNHDSSGGIQKPHALRTRTLTRLDSPNVSRSTVYERHFARRSAALPGVGSEGRSKLGIVETSTGVGVRTRTSMTFVSIDSVGVAAATSEAAAGVSTVTEGNAEGKGSRGGHGKLPAAAAEAKEEEKEQPPHARPIVALARSA